MESRSLSQTEARVVLSLESEDRVDLSLGDIRRRARISPGFARKVAHDLVRKGWLQRVGRGRYLLSPSRHGPDAVPDTDPLRFGSRLASPYYFGYATAAELLGLLPQASRVYYIVTPTPGSSRWKHVAEFRRVTLAPSRFFGVRTIERRGEKLVVSDLERTVLDCLARPEFAGGPGGVVQVLEGAVRRLDWKRLSRYLRRWGQRSLELRLGFLLDEMGLARLVPRDVLAKFHARSDDPYVPLGPPREFGRKGRHDPRWHVIRNVPTSVLKAEVDVR
jgi:predicted transcriptional regulator of viral defense system